jgi:hypothetical protein
MSRKFWSLLLAAMLAPCAAPALAADETEQGLSTLWEVLWHQSGTPTRIVRWENEIRLRLVGIDLPQHREYIVNALRTVTGEAGVRLVDVSDQPNAAQVANLKVEVTPDTALEDNQPCVTYLDFRTEDKVDTASIQMRSKDVYRCAYHEGMHLMGVRGHPGGQTVLSYFPVKVDGLLPLDRVMLRAWYSPRMKGGMTPFEALPILADELVATAPDKAVASQARDRFYTTTMDQMQAYAAGKGDIPLHRQALRQVDRGRHPPRPQRDELLPGRGLLRGHHRARRPEAGAVLVRTRGQRGQPRRAGLAR